MVVVGRTRNGGGKLVFVFLIKHNCLIMRMKYALTPNQVTESSSEANLSRAAPVINDASGGKHYSPGAFG
jgi:hypothetical protein